MRVEHARILASTAGREDPAWRYRLNVSQWAVYRTVGCNLAYAIKADHVPCQAAVRRFVERREPLAFAEPVPQSGVLPGF